MAWSRLLTSFYPEEETVNFGTRFAFESQEKLFDVVTQATIQGSDSFPSSIRTNTSDENLHLSLDSALHVIRESNPLSFRLTASITFLLESPCSNFLLVGLQNEIRLLHLKTGSFLPPIHTHCPSALIGALFQSNSLLLFNEASSLIAIKKINFSLINESLLNADINALKKLQADLIVEKPIPLSQDFGTCIRGTYFYGDHTLAKLDITQLPSMKSITANIDDITIGRVCVPLTQPDIMLILDKVNGHLYVVCSLTLVLLKSWTIEPLNNIVLLEESSEEAELKIIMITRRETLQIREFPSFELMYELEVHSVCHLIESHSNQETPFFLEGSEKGSELCLRLRGIVEASPEARLNRLLRRNKFDEALGFVKTFRLHPEEVYKAKTLWLLERLSPWNISIKLEDIEKDFNELKLCFNEIQDKDFVVQTCIKAALPTIKSTKSLLIYAREMIRNNLNELPVDLLVFVSQTLQKIDTFRLLGGKDVEEWMIFLNGKSYDIMLSYIKRKAISEAKLMWTRHLAEFTAIFDSESIIEILNEFKSYNDAIILEWCEIFIPDCLKLVPESLPLISEWAYSIIISMESRRGRGWPHSGLNFSEKILKTMTFMSDDDECSSEAQLILFQERSKSSSSLNKFIRLIDILKDLMILHNNYRLKIKLENFLEDDKIKVARILLDWTSPEEIPNLIHGYLNEYLQRGSSGKLNVSEVYENYLLDLIEDTSATWHWNLGAAPWEEKVLALIPFIFSVEKKTLVILKSLKSAPVPWSQSMVDLCAMGSNISSSSYVVAIKEQETLVSLKQILKRYHFRSYEISSKVQAEKMMKIILRKSGGSCEGHNDIKEICNVVPFLEEHDATLAYIRFILQDNSESPMKEIIDLVSSENREFLCQKILSYAMVFEKYSTNENKNIELQNYLSFLSFTIDETLPFSLREEFESFKKSFDLSRKLDIPRREHSEETLKDYITSNHKVEVNELFRRIRWIGSSFNLNESTLLITLIEELIRNENIKDANTLISKISHRSFSMTTDIESLLKMIIHSCEFALSNHLDLIQNFKELVSVNLTFNEHGILDLCELSVWLRIILSVFSTRNKNFLYSIHSFLYVDKGLPVALDGMRPFINAMKVLFPFGNIATSRYKPLCLLFQTKESSNDSTADQTVLSYSHITKPSVEDNFEYQKKIEEMQSLMNLSIDVSNKNAQSLLSVIIYITYRNNIKLLDSLMVDRMKINMGSMQNSLIESLFKKVMGERKKELDCSLALTCLINESEESSLNILSATNSSFTLDFTRSSVLARIGCNYSNLFCTAPIFEKYKSYLKNVIWAKKAVDLGVAPKDAFIQYTRDTEKVINKLVKVTEVSIEDLVQFASSYELEVDEVLVLYAEEQLSKNCKSLINKMQEIINSMHNSSTVSTLLYEMWNAASSYNYEVLQFIICGLQSRASPNAAISKAAEVLEFLKYYDRVSSPSESERSVWMTKYKVEFKKFPEDVANKRLPLTPLVTLPKKEKFNLLGKEFQLTNYKLWVSVAHVLNFNSDNILVKTIENAFEDMLNSSDHTKDGLSFDSNNEKLLEKIYECLNAMTDFFKATSCAYWILNKLPMGRDKVNTSKKYVLIAEKWKEVAEGTEDEARSISALEFAIDGNLRVETEFILIKYGLSEQRYLDMVNEKAIDNLVLSLYEHDSIIKRSKTAGGDYPDINGAVEEIAKIQKISLMSLKYDMLTNWLPENKDLNYMDESLSLDFHQSSRRKNLKTDEKDKDNYIRCVYISQCSELHHFLMSIALGKSTSMSSVHSTSHKLRALKCLLSVVDENAFEKLAITNYSELLELYSSLIFVSKLESLGLHYDLETYKSCDKKILIESILRSSGVTKEGLDLIVDLSIFFSIFDSMLWDDLLKRLVQHSSSRLESVLLRLNHQPHLWHLENFLKAWNHLVLQPFISNENHSECDKALQLLNKCPLDLNVEELKGECIRLQFHDLAEKLSDIYL
ncbi:kinetochore-associated protein 1 [Lepeophtheirus salmonis]|uniref:kinetochore-associated protein 1 n=1 Tax=Lepeophtheirus salmonis TaxID=72036 RepID=UPI001AE5E4CA|nr:kinetochore-associated protein 1-like [Lepeophtheirus salmonis]